MTAFGPEADARERSKQSDSLSRSSPLRLLAVQPGQIWVLLEIGGAAPPVG